MSASTIICDKCNAEFDTEELKFEKKEVEIQGKKFEVVYYKCPECKEPYVVCMLDYWGEKLQRKYISAMDSYRKLYNSGLKDKSKLQQKFNKMKELKKEALDYQSSVLHEYGNLIPEEIFS